MARHTGRKSNANCSNKQNRTNPSAKNKQGKGKNMPNAGKKTKTVGRPKKSHCNENKMVQHTVFYYSIKKRIPKFTYITYKNTFIFFYKMFKCLIIIKK